MFGDMSIYERLSIFDSDGTSMTELASDSDGQRTFGVLFIGFIISSMLYGLTFFQTYLYYAQFPKDKPRTMITVAILWALDTAATGLSSHALYFYLITEFGRPFGFLSITSMLCVENTLTVIIVFIIQTYLISRLLDVGHRARPAMAIGFILALASFALGIYTAVGAFQQKQLVALAMPTFRLSGGLYTGFSTICDLYIIFVSCWYFRPAVTPSVKAPEGFVDKAFMYVFSRGMFIGIVQFLLFLTFVINPAKSTWLPFHLVLGKVYINSLLATLNCRDVYNGRGINEGEILRVQIMSSEEVNLQHQDTFGDYFMGTLNKPRSASRGSGSRKDMSAYFEQERERIGSKESERPIQLTLIKHPSTELEDLAIRHENETYKPHHRSDDTASSIIEFEDQPILDGKRISEKEREKRNSRHY